MKKPKRESLYKVYVQTKDHPHILEMIVSAESRVSAEEKAVNHVKAANPTKGRTLEQSQLNSYALFSKKAGIDGCLVTNKIPVIAFRSVTREMARKRSTG
ncbi:hypothetical protein [Ralstonia solanacearum]|uniref:hypothetical protein n=1 Tax=Ralstonia solanacearum TaxID=305 RepID=UPI0012D7D10F|nr:hypothetical protein [Ralstonia solanacearum]